MVYPTIIIEHCEPKLWDWCLIEYRHSAKKIPKKQLWFTHLGKDTKKLSSYGQVFEKPFSSILPKSARVCILDPIATETLSPKDVKIFDYFVIGGILGEEEFNGRTGEEVTRLMPNSSVRNLGKAQFTIDGAAYITYMILLGTPLPKIPCVQEVTIPIKKGEEVDLPYSYPVINGKPFVSKELISYLKNKKDF